MLHLSVRPYFHHVEARVGLLARFQPIKLRNTTIAALFRAHHRLRRPAINVRSARFNFHKRHLVLILYDQIGLSERRAVIFMKNFTSLRLQVFFGKLFPPPAKSFFVNVLR